MERALFYPASSLGLRRNKGAGRQMRTAGAAAAAGRVVALLAGPRVPAAGLRVVVAAAGDDRSLGTEVKPR